MDCTAIYSLREELPPRRASLPVHLKVILLSLVGGALGIVGAFFSEVQAGGAILLTVIGAPIIEEAFKPIGVYLSLRRWPDALRSQWYIACLAALGGLVFGVLECLVYLYVYVPDHSSEFALYRWTLPLVLHSSASFLVGMGLNRRVVEWMDEGRKLPRRTVWFYFAGVALHAAFNTILTVLYVADVITFD